MRVRLLAIVALVAVTVPVAASDSSRAEAFLNVGGTVLAGGSPVSDALVIAFGLSTQHDERANTDSLGQFALAPLPLGVYRVIAVKRGFAPALAVVSPARSDHRLSIRLRRETALTSAEKEDVWEIRRALPRDILREVEAILAEPEDGAGDGESHAALAGDLMSLQGFDSFASAKTADRTSLALRGGVGEWSLDIAGHRRTVGIDDAAAIGAAEAADVALELRAPKGGSYRIASSTASWPQLAAGESETAIANHSIAWTGRQTRLTLRYFERENVFQGETGPSGGMELEGDRTIYRSDRAGIGVQVRVAEETFGAPSAAGETTAYAELMTVGDFSPVPSFSIGYGLLTRAGRYGGVEYVPQAAASAGSMRIARITISGACKVGSDTSPVTVAPVVTEMGRIPAGEARYRYGVALSRDLGHTGSVTASATVTEADNTAYVFFDDRFEEFWDGLYVERGDEARSVALAATAAIMSMTFGFDASAGTIDAAGEPTDGRRQYLVAAMRASYDGSGTSVDVAYRQIDQPLADDSRVDREIERLSVVLAQSLRLPVDLRLMVGLALTRERDSGGQVVAERDAKRLVGGVAFSF
ncbi:MAG: carboxypeptidase-like regulatory domain-containing protein [Thermoanaerobaculia bacterium]|jgi:hypothetical protein